ncbi:A-kinase anchor protein 13 isoform X1, partial [Lates japonicus]
MFRWGFWSGQCVITVQLADEELAADEEGVDYFLLFAGSTQRHLTSTLRSSHDTLQAVCPAHDCCEAVLVTLCSVSRGVPDAPVDPKTHLGRVALLAEHRFNFVQDLAFDMAQFLVSTAGRADGLDGALLLDECQIPLQECERLDESLALALHHLVLPPGWSLLGNKQTNSTDLNPQETLLHFSARRGLFRVAHFLLRQPGAREALQLANRQGHTPSAIAALRGHGRLYELFTKADTDTEADKGTEGVHLVSTDARVICHLPRLNTHTLTLRIHPGCEPQTLQSSVEQLLHLICHLHAKGVSVLELRFDSLHTAAECCDGIEAEITCVEQLQRCAAATECLDTTTESSWEENCPAESNRTDCGHGETGNAEKDWSLSVSTPASEVRPQEYGLGPPEDRVCLSSNTGRDYGHTEEEEEGREQPVASTQSLSLCNRSEGAQSAAEGANLTVGILPPAGCGKQAEETDRGEAVIQEGQEATKGEDRSEQEEENSTARRREEETSSEATVLITPSGDTKALVMGQSPSSEGSEVSDNSDSERKDCSQEGETIGKEEMKLSKELCDGLSLHEEKAEHEGLTDPVSTPRDLPNPSLIDCGDVIEEPESAFSRLLIEGLHEGEPPPDINNLEQNQETAGSTTLPMDETDNTADCRTAGNPMEATRIDKVDCEESQEIMPSSDKRHPDLDSCVAHGLSSDDDGSFRSVGSSTTEIFHPTQDDATMEEQELIQTKVAELMEEPNDMKPSESDEHSSSMDAGLPLEPDTVSVLTVTDQTGTEPESQLPPSPQTMEALNPDGAGEEPVPELSKEDLSLGPGLSESEDSPTVNVEERETGGDNGSDLNAEIEHSASEVSSRVLSEPYSAQVDPPSPNNEASSEPLVENQLTENPKTLDAMDGGNESHTSAIQEEDVIKSEDTVIAAGEEENDTAVETDFSAVSQKLLLSVLIHRDREASFHQPCNLNTQWRSSQSSAFPSLPSRTSSTTSCPSAAHRDSGSDIESFLNAEPGYDSVFRKNDEPVTGGDSASEVSVSCSSTDDTASVGPSSSSPEGSQGLGCSWSPEEGVQTGATTSAGLDGGGGGGGGGVGEAEEEAKDRVTEVPRRSCLLRNSIRSLSPLRRHSWGPGKNNGGDAEMNQRSAIRSLGEGKPTFHRRSYSLEGLSGGQEELRGPTTQGPRILEPLRMPRHDSDDRGSLVSLTEEQEELGERGRLHDQKMRRYRPLRNSCSPMTLPLTKSVSMLAISHRDIDGMRSFSSNSGSLAY